jgi:hypothetical protein
MSDQDSDFDQQSAVDQQKAIGDQQGESRPRPGTLKPKNTKDERQAAADYSKVQKQGSKSMRIKVYSPFRDYFDGQAFSISAENETGPFDILPRHHNFISLLRPCDLIIRSLREGEKKIIISGGIMHVKADQVIVFLDV